MTKHNMTWKSDRNKCHYINESQLIDGKMPYRGTYKAIEIHFKNESEFTFYVYQSCFSEQGQSEIGEFHTLEEAKQFCIEQ